MVEVIADGGFHQFGRLHRGQLFLGLALELWIGDKHGQHDRRAAEHVIGHDLGGLLVLDEIAVTAQSLGKRAAQARFVGAAQGRRHGVAVGIKELVLILGPGDGPFHSAGAAVELGLAEKRAGGQGFALVQDRIQIVFEPAGEVQGGARRCLGFLGQEVFRAGPADFHAAIEIRLGAAHAIEGFRAELGLGAENLGVGGEGHRGAAPVGDFARVLQLALGFSPLIRLGPELLVTCHLDGQLFRQRVDHRETDAMQTAGGLVRFAAELTARVQRGHDHFQRRLGLELGVGVRGDAPAVVPHGNFVAGGEFQINARRLAGDRLVHGVVQDFGDQMMQRPVVSTADIHAGPAADRFQPFQHLDILGGIGLRLLFRLGGVFE